jgi:hypothetical protein
MKRLRMSSATSKAQSSRSLALALVELLGDVLAQRQHAVVDVAGLVLDHHLEQLA